MYLRLMDDLEETTTLDCNALVRYFDKRKRRMEDLYYLLVIDLAGSLEPKREPTSKPMPLDEALTKGEVLAGQWAVDEGVTKGVANINGHDRICFATESDWGVVVMPCVPKRVHLLVIEWDGVMRIHCLIHSDTLTLDYLKRIAQEAFDEVKQLEDWNYGDLRKRLEREPCVEVVMPVHCFET